MPQPSRLRSPSASARNSLEDPTLRRPSYVGGGRHATLDDDQQPTCLSALPHTPNADRDSLFRHYMGCLEFRDRDKFLDEKNEFWSDQVTRKVQEGITRFRKAQPATPSVQLETAERVKLQEEARAQVKKTIQSLAISIEAQYKRTEVLRNALSKKEEVNPADKQPKVEQVTLVDYLNRSCEEWKNSQQYQDGIIQVQRWRAERHGPGVTGAAAGKSVSYVASRDQVRGIITSLRKLDDEIVAYDLRRDVNAYLIQYTRNAELAANMMADAKKPNPASVAPNKNLEVPQSLPQPLKTKGPELPVLPIDESLTDPRFKGKFPDQRVSVDLLLKSTVSEDGKTLNSDPVPKEGAAGNKLLDNWNILSKRECDVRDDTRLRYLHIPANNMQWVEAAIAGYYDDKDPVLRNGQRDVPATTRTQMLLRPQVWRGQLHGARSSVVHARYMRPLCERISSSVDEIEDSPNNIVLFMPYMHWETDRMRNTVAKMIEEQSCKQLQKQEKADFDAKTKRSNERTGVKYTFPPVAHKDAGPDAHFNASLDVEPKRLARSVTGIVNQVAGLKQNGLVVEEDGHLRVTGGRPLGQYLMDAARLYEAMSIFRDRRLIEDYLYRNPPLHPRRTLDQSHYWTLKTTKARDRDQVVYRGTNINLHLCHRFCKVPIQNTEKSDWRTKYKNLKKSFVCGDHDSQPVPQAQNITVDETQNTGLSCFARLPCKSNQRVEEQWQWVGHWSKTDKHGCEHCTSEIKKVSKLIMVDQLWMWVLDEQTIITSFPRRYGYNKYDLHGIHKSIRNRLASARKNQIRTIFDIALIILDECSNTFFDRTKTHDSQPQVMDIFSEAIGDVTNKHTISFQHVWHWMQKASRVYRSKPKHDETSDLHVPLLDIHPEGKLQREVKDILDELEIMINITRRQREIIRRFCKHVENILDPEGRWRRGPDDSPLILDDDVGDTTAASEERDSPRPEFGARSQSQTGEASKTTEKANKVMAERARRKTHLTWFRMQSQDLLCEIGDRVDELEG